ncbi:MAG: substrate-binding domain-containing protein [Devosia indica]|uniref:LacI family DNA-binding transcriptional regulator n=1 Tax=Devosia TaxID=46913 RepID=UPI000CE953C8|nr:MULTISPECIES: LacI family DNA-binding transcriptional regulator [Devosia]AVF04359.1 LacI family transcriptional regulator [Devosia sp. I507]
MSNKDERPNRVPTSDDVALLAGVSRSAVSRTFTAGASVAPATREKVISAAKTLGYRVNFLARGLSQQRTNLVALIVSDMDNSLRARTVDFLARGLATLGFRPLLLPTEPGEDVSYLIDMMLNYNVTGTIVTSDTPPAEIAQECAAYGVPLVLINKPEVGTHVSNVSIDTATAGRLAAEELATIGCKRIGIVSQRRASHTIGQRKAAFIATIRALGLDIAGDFQGAVQNYGGGAEAAEAFAESGIAVDGIYCVNDFMALGFLDHFRRLSDLRIPEDIKLIACDDIAEAAWRSYDITSVRQDPKSVADAAITALSRRLEDPEAAQPHVVIPVTLIRRGTTGASDPT